MYLIANGKVITRDDAMPYIENGGVVVEGTKIIELGETAALKAKYPDAEFIDAKGNVIMPAFINVHSHIYSALARGLSIKGYNPTNFYEILDGMWWAIDRNLDPGRDPLQRIHHLHRQHKDRLHYSVRPSRQLLRNTRQPFHH